MNDLMSKYVQEFPTDKLVSIPVAKLQDYKSVPFHLTEEDIRANIEMEKKESLEQRSHLLDGKKQDILTILANWSFNHQSQPEMKRISTELNDLLFEEARF